MIRILCGGFRPMAVLVILLTVGLRPGHGSAPMRYAVARAPTPVLNTPDFPSVFGGYDRATLKLNQNGLIKELEIIALPGTVFTIEGVFTRRLDNETFAIYRVTTNDYRYPTDTGYYIDSRFVTLAAAKPPERPKRIPSRREMAERVHKAVGLPYLWGGNVIDGVPEMLRYYPPAPGSALPSETLSKWSLKGFDCSGLIYYITGGYTFRNSNLFFGDPVRIEGLTAEQIAAVVKPLDLIVYKGHVCMILNPGEVIESRLDYEPSTPGNQGGVRIRRLTAVLDELIRNGRIPVNDYGPEFEGRRRFVIRRWYHRTD